MQMLLVKSSIQNVERNSNWVPALPKRSHHLDAVPCATLITHVLKHKIKNKNFPVVVGFIFLFFDFTVNLGFYELGFYELSPFMNFFQIPLRNPISLRGKNIGFYEPRFLWTSAFMNFFLSPLECLFMLLTSVFMNFTRKLPIQENCNIFS